MTDHKEKDAKAKQQRAKNRRAQLRQQNKTIEALNLKVKQLYADIIYIRKNRDELFREYKSLKGTLDE